MQKSDMSYPTFDKRGQEKGYIDVLENGHSVGNEQFFNNKNSAYKIAYHRSL